MEHHDSDSDEAPGEYSFQAGNEELRKSKDEQSREIANIRQQLKSTRRLKHEKNKIQKDEKRRRLEELESKKLPDDLLSLIKDTEVTKDKTIENKKQKPRKRKKKKLKEDNPFSTSVNDSVIVQVRPLATKEDKDGLRSVAENFLNSRLYKNKDIKRMPSCDIRKMREKKKRGGRTANFAVSK